MPESQPGLGEMYTGRKIVSVTPGSSELTNGVCRALWIGVAGTINITDATNTDIGPITVPVGLFPIACKKVRSGGTSTEVWAIY